MRCALIAATCLLIGAALGWWGAGSYGEHLARELRACEAALDAK